MKEVKEEWKGEVSGNNILRETKTKDKSEGREKLEAEYNERDVGSV